MFVLSSSPTQYIPTPMAWYRLSVLKVLLNTNQPTRWQGEPICVGHMWPTDHTLSTPWIDNSGITWNRPFCTLFGRKAYSIQWQHGVHNLCSSMHQCIGLQSDRRQWSSQTDVNSVWISTGSWTTEGNLVVFNLFLNFQNIQESVLTLTGLWKMALNGLFCAELPLRSFTFGHYGK